MLLLLAIVLLSGCSNTYSVDPTNVKVSQYLCANNGGWQYLTCQKFDRMDIQCFDGSLYRIKRTYNRNYNTKSFYVEGNMNEDINKKLILLWVE